MIPLRYQTAHSRYNASLGQALELRCRIFIHLNYARYLADGLVGSGADRAPLRSGSWAFIFSDDNVYVGEGTRIISRFHPQITDTLAAVLALYSKEPSAESKHAWQALTNPIGAISYLVVQMYEATAPSRTNQFRSGLNSQITTRAERTFLHVPATRYLYQLQDPPILAAPGKLALSEKDLLVFRKVAGTLALRDSLAEAIKGLNAATRGKKPVTE